MQKFILSVEFSDAQIVHIRSSENNNKCKPTNFYKNNYVSYLLGSQLRVA